MAQKIRRYYLKDQLSIINNRTIKRYYRKLHDYGKSIDKAIKVTFSGSYTYFRIDGVKFASLFAQPNKMAVNVIGDYPNYNKYKTLREGSFDKGEKLINFHIKEHSDLKEAFDVLLTSYRLFTAEQKLLFFNIGWMKDYDGLQTGITITGGGKYVQNQGFGHEIFNFRSYKGFMYGYGQPNSQIRIERLDASKIDTSIKPITVVWVAPHPQGGNYIIGWYKNATVYRLEQKAPSGSSRIYNQQSCGFYTKANESDCHLLPIDERTFFIPRAKYSKFGGFGQTNVWYADKAINKPLVDKIRKYIKAPKSYYFSKAKPKKKKVIDQIKKQKVEKNAIEKVWNHYESLGYKIHDVQKDNVGWDLEASLNMINLKVEVKGLSGSNLSTELSPNEYAMLKKYISDYRIAIVTNALTKALKMSIFSFSPDKSIWEDETGNELKFENRTAARIYVK